MIGTLDEQTRLARVLVTVDDPLGQMSDVPPLILDTLIEVRIQGQPIENVVRVNRDYVHEGSTVWVMKNEKLEVRDTEIVFQDAENAYIGKGLEDGEEIVTTTLSTGRGRYRTSQSGRCVLNFANYGRGAIGVTREADNSAARMGPIAWMARNSIAANLLMFILLGGGIWSAIVIQKEVFPESQLDIVEVRVGYPGASPSEVEQGILAPIEGAVRDVDGIERITSEAREGRGEVVIELVAGQDRMKAFQDIDQAVSRIRTFPEQIENPEVNLESEQRGVMRVSLYGR